MITEKRQKELEEGLSNFLNPMNKYKRTQREIEEELARSRSSE